MTSAGASLHPSVTQQQHQDARKVPRGCLPPASRGQARRSPEGVGVQGKPGGASSTGAQETESDGYEGQAPWERNGMPRHTLLSSQKSPLVPVGMSRFPFCRAQR